MELVWQPYSIIPVYQGQRGFSLFLTADQGWTQIHRLLFPCPFFNLQNMLYDQCRPFSGVKKGSSASFAYGDTV
jgi:hypothetical protein